MTDPAIAPTYYPDSGFEDKKKRAPRRPPPHQKDSGQDGSRGRNYSLSRIPSTASSHHSGRRDESPDRPRPRRERRSYSGKRRDSGYSRSPSPRRRSPRRYDYEDSTESEKAWYKKKTLWATIASIASVASVAATSLSARATLESASATKQSAAATKRSAKATMSAAEASHRSADASTRIADGNDLSTRAVVNTAVANGHQDHRGRYLGPAPPEGVRMPRARRGSWDRIANGRERRRSRDRHTSSHHSNRSSAGRSHSHKDGGHAIGQKPKYSGLLEYQPMAKV